MNVKPNSLQTLSIAANMARIALNAMAAGDPRKPEALERLRKKQEDLRVFIYKQKGSLTANGKLLRP